MKKLTQEEVIKRFKEVHGDKYDYSLVEYIDAKTKVKIICKLHGAFEQMPDKHYINQGCKECKKITLSNIKSDTKFEFIEKAKAVHGNKYNYDKVVYKNSHVKITINCTKHGVFKQTPNSHLNGNGCPGCGIISRSESSKFNNEVFIKKAIETHKNKYDYSLVDYVNSKTKVNIVCKINNHGLFKQEPTSHLLGQGCPKCAKLLTTEKRTKTTEEFIKESMMVHGYRYDYSLVDYKGNRAKVKIICTIHGIFEQTSGCHLSGKGCSKCGFEKSKVHHQINPVGWTITNWEKAAGISKNFDRFKVYIIRCWNDNEEFYKIGRTFKKTKERFRGLKYKYEILKELIFDTAKEAFDKETKLKRLHKKYKYIPKINFGGMYECFSEINLETIYETD